MADTRITRKLQKASDLLTRGAAREAAELCRHVLEAEPGEPAAWMLFSKCTQQLGQFERMIQAAERAVALRPRNVDARLRLAECRLYSGDVAGALEVVRDVERAAGQRAGALLRAGEFYVHLGQHADAYRCQLKALELRPDDAPAVFAAAASCVALGDLAQAEKLYRRVIFLDPGDYDAWYNRSTLRTWSLRDNHVKELQYVLSHLGADDSGRVPVCFALARELEDLERYAEAFEYLQQGALQRRRRLSYDVAEDERAMADIATAFGKGFMERKVPGHASERPVFVLGLPRSGTTLVDRIVSSHSEARSLGEINTLVYALLGAAGGIQADRGRLIRRAAEVDLERLGRSYLAGLEGFGHDEPRLIDKTPVNFLYLGLIHKALPGARIIHLRRHPVDSCFAMYKTLFRMGYPFSYSLQDTGRYYIAYHRLMEHWRAIMPGAFLEVDYERLVTDTEPEVRRILDYLGLGWEAACLEFHRSREPTATASAAQVRRPIYRSSVGRWKYYKRELAPLAGKLRKHGIPVD